MLSAVIGFLGLALLLMSTVFRVLYAIAPWGERADKNAMNLVILLSLAVVIIVIA